MKSQAGFTFTELLTGVTILVMLAAVAVPRHEMLNRASRSASVRSLEANVRSSAELSRKVWEAAGHPAHLSLDGKRVDMRYGYPTATSINDVVVKGSDFRFSDGYWKHVDSQADQGCAVLYIPPSNPEANAVVIGYTDGC